MKKILFIIPFLVFAINGIAFGWGTTGGDGTTYGQLQETAVFYNNTGEKIYSGWACTIDTTATAATTLGAYVNCVDAADSRYVVGVAKYTAVTGGPVVVITRGPALVESADSTDALTAGSSVGTTTLTSGGGSSEADAIGGFVGGGAELGVAMENGDGTDHDEIWIWVAIGSD
jgi:hypothetical protein